MFDVNLKPFVNLYHIDLRGNLLVNVSFMENINLMNLRFLGLTRNILNPVNTLSIKIN